MAQSERLSEKLYVKTNDGLDIILHYYPEAADTLTASDGKQKKFKMRNERTPSASLRMSPKKKVWVVTDFGDDGHEITPIQLASREEGVSWKEALFLLCGRYGVRNELDKDINKPLRGWIDLADGSRSKDFDQLGIGDEDIHLEDYVDDFVYCHTRPLDEEELEVMGPLVKAEHAASLKWQAVGWKVHVSNGKARFVVSTPTYPIFRRECVVDVERRFFKLYEPYNYDKGFRFQYYPKGGKPARYVNGLAELRQAYTRYNEDQAHEWESDPKNEGKPYHYQKLDAAYLCSGERDSLCVRSVGGHPLWLNSESDTLTPDELQEVLKMVDVLYNIPDIDETGLRLGTQLALKYLDIHTIWLPKTLSGYMDMRGKGRKDLRDWMELHPSIPAFRNLANTAMPARFWTSRMNKDGRWSHEIDTACLHEFLRLNGFCVLREPSPDDIHYIRIQGNHVRTVGVRDIREFVIDWARQRMTTDVSMKRDVLNLILNTPKLTGAALESLPTVDLDFTSYTSTDQFFFFQNKTVRVDASGVHVPKFNGGSEGFSRYVWEENVLPFHLRPLDDLFTIRRTEDGQWDIDIHQPADAPVSKFLGYLINSSRLFWRDELEKPWHNGYFLRDGEEVELVDDDGTPFSDQDYARRYHFAIDGPLLAPEDIAIQKKNLIAKIYGIGYALHQYKDLSKTWALYCMDAKTDEEGACNGRSGKSFFMGTLARLLTTVKLDAQNPRLTDNPHIYERVTPHTQLLLFDDCARYFSVNQIFNVITGDMTVNPKNMRSFNIPYSDSPKIAFTTNFVPMHFDGSTEGRLLFEVFSDYYHARSEGNTYRETRTIHDDFGKNLYGPDYTVDEWNADLNFFLQCCRFYLSCSEKIQPPMGDILTRRLRVAMGSRDAGFEDWADGYFSPASGHLDTYIRRQEMVESYQAHSKNYKWSAQKFSDALKAYVKLHADLYELNPPEVRQADGRIMKYVPETRKAEEHYYVKALAPPSSPAAAAALPSGENPSGHAPAADRRPGVVLDDGSSLLFPDR